MGETTIFSFKGYSCHSSAFNTGWTAKHASRKQKKTETKEELHTGHSKLEEDVDATAYGNNNCDELSILVLLKEENNVVQSRPRVLGHDASVFRNLLR